MYRVHNTWSFKLSLFLIKFQCDCFPESQEKCFYYDIIVRNRTMNKGEMTFFSITPEMHNTCSFLFYQWNFWFLWTIYTCISIFHTYVNTPILLHALHAVGFSPVAFPKNCFFYLQNYDSSESKLRREFEVYGPIRKVSFLEFSHVV